MNIIPEKIETIVLDVDGVITDFCGHSLTWHSRMDVYDIYPRGMWDIPTILGMTPKQFWAAIDNSEFWSTLPVYPGAAEFLAALVKMAGEYGAEVVFCTRPAGNVGPFTRARKDMLDSLTSDANLPKPLPLYFACGSKSVFGRPTSLLVDDYHKNIDEFADAGGRTLLVPMPWNTLPGEEPEGCEVYMDGPDYTWVLKEVCEKLGGAL